MNWRKPVIPVPERTIKYWLVFDWKDEDVRARKTKPSRSDLGTNELLVQGELTVVKPEIEVPKLATELQIPEARIRRAVADGMKLEQDEPDWKATVDEVVQENGDLVREHQVDALVGKVMLADPGSPPPEEVRDIIQELCRNVPKGEA